MRNHNLAKIREKLLAKKHLSPKQAIYLANLLTLDKLSSVQKAAILTLLAAKGEHSNELTGFAKLLRQKMTSISAPSGTIDVCGTGGDHKSTFNISTAAAIVVAAAGVPVAKHGNRSITSRCGSADVLEALGVNIDLTPVQAEKILYQLGITFLFAPNYHSAMKFIAPVRKQLGFPTIFNFLGPLLNPAKVKIQLIGTYNEKIAKKMIVTLKQLGASKAAVICGLDGMDEISITAPTRVFELAEDKISSYQVKPQDFGFPQTNPDSLRGGDSDKNAHIILDIFHLRLRDVKRDAVILNSAFALKLAKQISMKEAISLAEKALDSGRVARLLQKFKSLSNQAKKI